MAPPGNLIGRARSGGLLMTAIVRRTDMHTSFRENCWRAVIAGRCPKTHWHGLPGLLVNGRVAVR